MGELSYSCTKYLPKIAQKIRTEVVVEVHRGYTKYIAIDFFINPPLKNELLSC